MTEIYKIKFDKTISNFIDIFICGIVMCVVLMILNLVVPVNNSSRLSCLFIIILYAIIGAFVYGICTYKNGVLKRVTGNRFVKFFKTIDYRKR